MSLHRDIDTDRTVLDEPPVLLPKPTAAEVRKAANDDLRFPAWGWIVYIAVFFGALLVAHLRPWNWFGPLQP